MRTARRTFVATGTVAILAAAGVTAAIAANPAPAPPPKIAFLANGIVPADALAAGPIAGQLGAPMYTTQPDTLSPAAATGLGDYDPELVIVLGGPVAIHDTVITQVENATGLSHTDDVTPAGGIVRAAGGDRFDTAAAVADLLAAYNPAYLPINMQAIDADKLDGKDASEFALKSDLGAGGGDADTLDGKDSTDFLAADGKAQTAGHADTAGDADTLDGIDASAYKRIDFNVFGVQHDSNASMTRSGSDGKTGIRLPSGSSPDFAMQFSVPDDFTPGSAFEIAVLLTTDGTGCTINLATNFTSFARPGSDDLKGASRASEGLTPVDGTNYTTPTTPHESVERRYTLELPATGTTLQPGDAVAFGFYRATDSCSEDVIVQSVTATYP